MRFNVVVANPPFSLDKWGQENASHDRFNRFWRGSPRKAGVTTPLSAIWLKLPWRVKARWVSLFSMGFCFVVGRKALSGRLSLRIISLRRLLDFPLSFSMAPGYRRPFLLSTRAGNPGKRQRTSETSIFSLLTPAVIRY